MLRVLLSISALLVAVFVAGVGAGVAVAEPDDGGATGSTGDTSETGETGNPPDVSEPTVVEPQPTTATPPRAPSIFDIPRNIANQLRDMLGRPLSVFGNGRVPGTHTGPDTSLPGAATTGHKRDKDAAKQSEPTVQKPHTSSTANPDPIQPPPRRTNSSADGTTPLSDPPVSVPVPDLPVPGDAGPRWKLDLSDPYAAYTSLGETLRTVNALLTDAFVNPFKPTPAPKPRTTFRVMDEEPVLDAGGTVAAVPLAGGSDSLPVQAPVLIPPIRLAPSRPITGSVPAAGSAPTGAGSQEVGAGQVGVRAPAVGESVPQPAAAPTGQLPPNASSSAGTSVGSPVAPSSLLGNPVPRQGYPEYLRSARITQVATVALPGLAGLIAFTAGGSVIGYRQANSGRSLRSGAERFLH
jgi:hypothetical protein